MATSELRPASLTAGLERAGRIAGAGLLLLAASYGARPLACTDLFWQVRTGELAFETGTVPDADSFSYTIAGKLWNNHEWLFELMVAAFHRLVGWQGFRALVLAASVALTAAVWREATRRAGAAWAVLVTATFFLTAAYKLHPVPQLVAMAMFFVGFGAFLREDLLARPRRAWALAAFMLCWGNLTAEALTFVPLLVLHQATCWLRARVGRATLDMRPWALAGVATAVVAPLVTPSWSSPLDYALAGTLVNRSANNEFSRLWEPGALCLGARVTAAAIGVAFLAYLVVTARAGRATLWARAPELVLSAVACVAALAVQRNAWMTVLPALHMSGELARSIASRRAAWAALALGAALGGATPWLFHDPRLFAGPLTGKPFLAALDPSAIPIGCVDYLAKLPGGQRIFAKRPWASFLIWRLPRDRVFIDGRNLEYGDELQNLSEAIYWGRADALALLDASQTDVVLAARGWDQQPAIARGTWRMVMADRRSNCAVYERAPAPKPSAP